MRTFAPFLFFLPLLAADKADPEFFEMQVRPILSKNCLSCHSASKMGGLDLTSREGLLKGGNSGPAIKLDQPDSSLFLKVLKHEHDRIKMPPAGKLPENEIEVLARWIRDGADWPVAKATAPVIAAEHRSFWAFQPIKKAVPPTTKNQRWARSPIDRFILAKLEEKSLTPAPPASKRTLLRRATFDLTGLPPTLKRSTRL